MGLRFLDIFAGIGSTRRGLENAGHQCVGYIEWDKWARKSYEAIFDTKGEWTASDVTTVRADELPAADIWTFGFPCQDLSVAGKRAGLDGRRSGLFFTVTRLIGELPEADRPEWLVAENVMGLFSSNRGWDFLATQIALDEIGYDVEWEVFNATQFGIPQNRQRVFLVGHLRNKGRREVFPLRIDDAKTAPELKCVGMLDMKGNEAIRRVYDPTGSCPTGSCPTVTTMGGGHREPKIIDDQGRRTKRLVPSDVCPTLRAQSHGNDPKVIGVTRKGRGDDAEWIERNVATCLDANYFKGLDAHQARTGVASHSRIRKLTPLECWRLMGRYDWEFHAAKNAGVSDTQLYKQAGNSLIPQIVQAIGERIADLSETAVVTS